MVSPSPRSVDSVNTEFPLRAGQVTTECSEGFQNGSFPLPLLEARGEFSKIFSVRTWLSCWMYISQYCGELPMTGSPWSFNSRTCLTEPPAMHQSQFRFVLPRQWFPQQFLLQSLLQWASIFVSACLSLQSWRQWFALYPHLSYESKKSCFFSLFSFLLAVRTIERGVVTQGPYMQNWTNVIDFAIEFLNNFSLEIWQIQFFCILNFMCRFVFWGFFCVIFSLY